MADDQRQRIQPTTVGRARLLAAIEAAGPRHDVDPGTLGEYAELVATRGATQADATMPDVAAHLATGCPDCTDELRELMALVSAPDEPDAAPGSQPLANTSGLHVAGLPDPRADEEAARLQRLRRIRDWLLIAAAVSVLLIGLSLVGMAYLASAPGGTPRVGLTPVPADGPRQPNVPPGQPGQPAPAATPGGAPAPAKAGRAAPTGISCPASHPIKGNRPSMIYHAPGGAFYEQTGPEECFASPADAEAAGYRPSQR